MDEALRDDFVKSVEELATDLHRVVLDEGQRRKAFEVGISVFQASVIAESQTVSGATLLNLDTPEYGNLWVVYREAPNSDWRPI